MIAHPVGGLWHESPHCLESAPETLTTMKLKAIQAALIASMDHLRPSKEGQGGREGARGHCGAHDDVAAAGGPDSDEFRLLDGTLVKPQRGLCPPPPPFSFPFSFSSSSFSFSLLFFPSVTPPFSTTPPSLLPSFSLHLLLILPFFFHLLPF